MTKERMDLMQQKTLVLVPHITISTALHAEPAAQMAAFKLFALIKVSMVDISTFKFGIGSESLEVSSSSCAMGKRSRLLFLKK